MNKTQKKLKIMDRQIRLVGRYHADQIRLMVQSGSLKLIMSENMVSQSSPSPDFMEMAATNTYADCVDVNLNPDETIKVEVWDGDARGCRNFRQAVYNFTGDWWKYNPLVNIVDNAFHNYTMDQVMAMEAQERENRRQAVAQRLLKELD